MSGVTQGSVLGQTLFMICINDIELAMDVIGSFLFKFADDIKRAWWWRLKSSVTSCIANLEQWSKEWQLMFKAGKFHILHLGSKNKEFDYVMGGQVLDNEKDVGVVGTSH